MVQPAEAAAVWLTMKFSLWTLCHALLALIILDFTHTCLRHVPAARAPVSRLFGGISQSAQVHELQSKLQSKRNKSSLTKIGLNPDHKLPLSNEGQRAKQPTRVKGIFGRELATVRRARAEQRQYCNRNFTAWTKAPSTLRGYAIAKVCSGLLMQNPCHMQGYSYMSMP